MEENGFMITAKNYGAYGDGIHDDYMAMQKAFDRLKVEMFTEKNLKALTLPLMN